MNTMLSHSNCPILSGNTKPLNCSSKSFFRKKWLKSKIKVLTCLVVLLGCWTSVPAQEEFPLSPRQKVLVDSFQTIINTPESHDSSVVYSYVGMSEILYSFDIDTVIPLCNKAIEVAEKSLQKDYPEHTKTWIDKYYADAVNNVGFIKQRKGDVKGALEAYHKSLKIKQRLNDQIGISTAYNNMGLTYQDQEDYKSALKYFKLSLKEREEAGHQWAIAQSHNNIGLLYLYMDSIPKAKESYFESLKIREEIGDKNGIAQTNNNLGTMYLNLDSGEVAAKHFYKSLEILKEIGYKEGMPYIYLNLSEIEYQKGTRQGLKKAEEYALKGLELSQELGFPIVIQNASLKLAQIYAKTNQGMKAYEMHKLYAQMRDSIINDANHKEVLRRQAEFEYEKQKEIDDLKHQQELAIEKEREQRIQEQQQRQFIILMIVTGSALVIFILLLIIYRRLKITRKQKIIIEEQKEEVETQRDYIEQQKDVLELKNREIQESIRAAERIQKAFFTFEQKHGHQLPEHFVFFQPLDIVSGDFYWVHVGEQYMYVAVVDCTGHGVPGAVMRMLGASFLNEIVANESGLEPAEILNRLRHKIVKELSQSGEEGGSKEGMDISLLRIESGDGEFTRFQWAGANNPVYCLRNNEEKEMEIIKGDREPIGYTQNPNPFTNHELSLQKGDAIYLFSDGFADQFGGPKNKKYGYKKFRELLLTFYERTEDASFEVTTEWLKQEFEEWKQQSGESQLDDVCIIGLKV